MPFARRALPGATLWDDRAGNDSARGGRRRRAGRVALSHARPHAQPLRRARPSDRRAAHRRQHHARVAADRRRLAAAAPPAERDPGADRSLLPHRRVGRRVVDRGVRDRGRRDRVDCLVADRIGHRRRRRRRGVRAESERPVSAVHADDRAAAARDDDGRGGDALCWCRPGPCDPV